MGQSVITFYNKKNYKIDRIDFEMNPNHEFEMTDRMDKTKKVITNYLDYYRDVYKQKIRDTKQPMLVNIQEDKKNQTQKTIYLVPELCYMTGLTDRQRNDFRLMKTIAEVTKLDAGQKNQQVQDLIEKMSKDSKSSNIMKDYKIEIEREPVKMKGYRLNPGNMLMGEGRNI